MNTILKKVYEQDIKTITEFIKNRPDVLACYCIGIGESYNKKIYKLILVVDDIWTWQQQNPNKKEYTMYSNMLYNHGYKYIQYIGINEEKSIFDYVLIDSNEFENNLLNWNNYTFAQIFQRPYIAIKSSRKFKRSILENQRNALTTSILLTNRTNPSLFELLLSLYAASNYPNNENISLVNTNYEILSRMYTRFDCFKLDKTSHLLIDYQMVKKNMDYLPEHIKDKIYIDGNYISMNEVKKYLEEKVKEEELDAEYMRVLVNGFLKTLSYNGRKNKTKTLKRKIDI